MKDPTIPTITAFKSSPDRGQGLARDMRVRWALEEVGQPYHVKLVTFEEMKQASYKALQPFGQIPAYTEGDLTLFESGAIILHLAEKNENILSREANARARAITWMFAALNTIEQPIVDREAFVILERDRPWFDERIAMLDQRVDKRLKDLSAKLGREEWLDGEFSAADILMVTVLRRIESSGLLEPYQNLRDYMARGEARPAYQRAFAAQLEVYRESLSK